MMPTPRVAGVKPVGLAEPERGVFVAPMSREDRDPQRRGQSEAASHALGLADPAPVEPRDAEECLVADGYGRIA
jgi:hypothetical protein